MSEDFELTYRFGRLNVKLAPKGGEGGQGVAIIWIDMGEGQGSDSTPIEVPLRDFVSGCAAFGAAVEAARRA